MTTSINKFEQLLELLINEENDKAQALFHEIVVEKSRDIYEGLAETEATVEAKHDNKDEKEMKETAVSEKMHDKKDMKETEKTDSKDESVDEEVEIEETSNEQESIEEVSGDATDDLITDVEADEKGDAEHGAEDFNKDGEIDGHEKEHADVENKIVDLEDALEELKAEFEKMMNGDNGDDKDDMSDESAVAQPAQDAQAEVAVAQEAKKDDTKKETVKEYKIQKSADNKDASDKSAKSPIVDAGTKMGHGGKNIAQADVAKEKAKVATAEKMGDFENTPGKDKATSYKKEVKADLKDGGDKSASKSPLVAAKK